MVRPRGGTKRERAYKQIEEKLGTERAVVELVPKQRAYANNVGSCCVRLHATIANNSQHCWVQ